jgi:uncharacterized membrane protein
MRDSCSMARAEQFGRFARRRGRDARSWAQPCLCHGAHPLAAAADVAPDGCRRRTRRAASAPHRSPRGAARDRAICARRFSTLGTISVSVLAVTALLQGTLLSGGLTGLTGTTYGAVLLLKTVLFAVLISIAAVNRFRLTPAFAGPDAQKARRALALSIGIETVVGLCVVFAASLLSSLELGMHMETHGQ